MREYHGLHRDTRRNCVNSVGSYALVGVDAGGLRRRRCLVRKIWRSRISISQLDFGRSQTPRLLESLLPMQLNRTQHTQATKLLLRLHLAAAVKVRRGRYRHDPGTGSARSGFHGYLLTDNTLYPWSISFRSLHPIDEGASLFGPKSCGEQGLGSSSAVITRRAGFSMSLIMHDGICFSSIVSM